MDKKHFRAKLRLKISELDGDYITRSNNGIRERLMNLPEYHAAETVFSYLSTGREVDTTEIINSAIFSGKRIALPISQPGGEMQFYTFDGELVSGLYGIPEPRQTSPVVPAPGDIMLVPALCIDYDGYRMGQGGGYYDRYLSSHRVVAVGLCRECLLTLELPREAHDISVDIVLTEKRTARPGEGPRE